MSRSRSFETGEHNSSEGRTWSRGSTRSEDYGVSESGTTTHGMSESWGIGLSESRTVEGARSTSDSYWGDPPARCCCEGHSWDCHCACARPIVYVEAPRQLSLDAHLDAIGAHIAALHTSPRTSRYQMRRLRRILTRLAERANADSPLQAGRSAPPGKESHGASGIRT
jgi:hypothetical protein